MMRTGRILMMLLIIMIIIITPFLINDAGPELQQTPPLIGARIIDMLIVGP